MGIFLSSCPVGRLSVSIASALIYEFSAAYGVDVRQPDSDSCCWYVACAAVAGVITCVCSFSAFGAEPVGIMQSTGDYAVGVSGNNGRVGPGGWGRSIPNAQLPHLSCGNRHYASTSWSDTEMARALAPFDHFDTCQRA